MGWMEEDDIKNWKLQDINLEIVNEHFQNMKLIVEKVSGNFIAIKTSQYQEEGNFIQTLFDESRRIIEFYIDISWKLRILSFE